MLNWKEKATIHRDSEAIITKGIIAILIRTFSNQYPKEILEANTDFIIKLAERTFIASTCEWLSFYD